ncbi:hypothetical protein ATHL_03604 [Anaerolinea thermolimosa]|uniref:Uncharacterized protein n=1 Tax=Anaerolinea thermolimosa TaxID=229919 RepID=A0A7U9KNU1_9CHLR|nr:hypothetical protein [Anaerolinea thermolimosa]GAP08697.1 hypothetical protein ATHL_03604 [Anaerolinea thermolimosa]
MHNIRTLVQQLRQPGSRVSVGVWFFPVMHLGHEEDIAVSLNMEPLDARQAYLERLPEGAKHSGLRTRYAHEKLFEFINSIGNSTYKRNCLLLHTFDLLLLGMEVDAREQFWNATLALPYLQTKLIIALPETAHYLLNNSLRFAPQIAEGAV